jgi:hypothetical protein
MQEITGAEHRMVHERHHMIEHIEYLTVERERLGKRCHELNDLLEIAKFEKALLSDQLATERKRTTAETAARLLMEEEVKKSHSGTRSGAATPPRNCKTPPDATHPAPEELTILRTLHNLPEDLLRLRDEVQRTAAMHFGYIEAGRPPGWETTPETLVLWDIENVGFLPAMTAADVSNAIHTLKDKLSEKLGIPNDGEIAIVAAHNPRSRDKDINEFYVASTLTQLGVQLADVGGKHGAADAALKRHLNKWLASMTTGSRTASHPHKCVVFITGDGDFAAEARDAKAAGCKTGLVYCDYHVNKAALLPAFAKEHTFQWGEVIGAAGEEALAERQRSKNAQQHMCNKQRECVDYDPQYAGRNPRPDLFKTALCEFHCAGEACLWVEKYGTCWFAHGVHEQVASD